MELFAWKTPNNSDSAVKQKENKKKKITSAQRKALDKAVKQKAKDYGFKFAHGFLFSQIGENFVYSICIVTDTGKVDSDACIKKMSYDNLFWNIMNMPDNKLQPLSFRARGAFTSPCILVDGIEIEFDEDLDAVADKYCSAVAETAKSFLYNNDIGEYVLTNNSIFCTPVLKCLEHLDRGNITTALEIAKQQIALGDCGGFMNEGKTFFEWVVYQINNHMFK